MFAELIFFFFWQTFFTPCTNPRLLSLGLIFHLLNPICHFATEFLVLNLLHPAVSPSPNQTHHFPLLGTSQVTPQGRTWWEQGSHVLCLPIPPPLTPAQRMRNPDLSVGQGRVPASPLPATSCASSMLLSWKGTTDTVLVGLTRRLSGLRISSKVKGTFKVLRYLPSPDLPFLPALLCSFLSPQPWNETENYFFKTVSIIYV